MKTTPASLEISTTEKEVKALEIWKGGHSNAQTEKEQAEITIIVLSLLSALATGRGVAGDGGKGQ